MVLDEYQIDAIEELEAEERLKVELRVIGGYHAVL